MSGHRGTPHAARIGVAVFGRDGQLLLSTPHFEELLSLPSPEGGAPGRVLDDILRALGRENPKDDRRRGADIECRSPSGRLIELTFEALAYDRCCVTVSDVTQAREAADELRRAREAAEAANQAKSRFLSTMSHELRTPLNAVIGFSEALAREDGGPELTRDQIAEFAGQIHEAGQHLLELINNILDVARIESGRIELASDLIDVDRMLRQTVAAMEGVALSAEVSVDVAVRPPLPRLRGDERRLRQVLTHLITNAIKFTPARGRVTVTVTCVPERNLVIDVRDTGIGIAEEDMERVFQPFNQLDMGLARRAAGAGLGLYFCRALVQAHGGVLKLDSRPGVGTTASIHLPRLRLIQSTPMELTR